jgi:hypothetical protein
MSLDTTTPGVPFDIFQLTDDEPDLTFGLRCDELWSEIMNELLDQRFYKRAHHNTGTYDQGCRGPLCRKALREHSRRKAPAETTLLVNEDRIYDPILEYFHTIMKFRIKRYQQEILKEVAQ